MIRVTVDDLRECGYCANGSRRMATQLDMNWSDFLKNGIDLSELESIDDAMIQVVVNNVKRKHGIE